MSSISSTHSNSSRQSCEEESYSLDGQELSEEEISALHCRDPSTEAAQILAELATEKHLENVLNSQTDLQRVRQDWLMRTEELRSSSSKSRRMSYVNTLINQLSHAAISQQSDDKHPHYYIIDHRQTSKDPLSSPLTHLRRPQYPLIQHAYHQHLSHMRDNHDVHSGREMRYLGRDKENNPNNIGTGMMIVDSDGHHYLHPCFEMMMAQQHRDVMMKDDEHDREHEQECDLDEQESEDDEPLLCEFESMSREELEKYCRHFDLPRRSNLNSRKRNLNLFRTKTLRGLVSRHFTQHFGSKSLGKSDRQMELEFVYYRTLQESMEHFEMQTSENVD